MARWVGKWLLIVGAVVALTFPISLPISMWVIEGAIFSPVLKIWYQRKFDARAKELGSVDAALGDPPYRKRYDHDLNLDELMAVVRFPDAASCLETSSGPERVAWGRFRVKADAEVCLFRILNRGVPLPQTVARIESLGLKVFRRNGRVSVIRQSYSSPVMFSISAAWGPQGPEFLDRRVFAWYNVIWRPYGQSFQIFTDSTGTRIVGVRLGYSYL